MPASELDAQLSWLFARQRFGVKPGLARVRALLTRLGNPGRAFDAVLVGGTQRQGELLEYPRQYHDLRRTAYRSIYQPAPDALR